jgi:hypothetical protein
VLDGALWLCKLDDPGPLPGDGWIMAVQRGAKGKPGERGGLTREQIDEAVAAAVASAVDAALAPLAERLAAVEADLVGVTARLTAVEESVAGLLPPVPLN